MSGTSALRNYLELPVNSYYGEILDELHNMNRVDLTVPITSKSRSVLTIRQFVLFWVGLA